MNSATRNPLRHAWRRRAGTQCLLALCLFPVLALLSVALAKAASGAEPLYLGNRPPLAPSPFMKLPIGSITPKGWLRGQLELEANGMTGHMPEISKWCKFEGNAWSDPNGQGHSAWEGLPYWLKGYGDLGYVLQDQRIIKETRKWVDA